MGVYSMLTTPGLNETNTADPENGVFIQVTHWVGVYDEALDIAYQGDDQDADDISNYTGPSEYYPQQAYPNGGDIVYWKNGVPADPSLPSKDDDLYTGVSYFPVSKFDRARAQGCWIVGDAYPVAETGDWWYVDSGGASVTYQGIEYNDNGTPCVEGADVLLWNGVEWNNAGSKPELDFRANFKVRVTAEGVPLDEGQDFTINKIAIYGIKRSSDGVLQENPFLLGQVIIPQPQTLKPKVAGQSNSFTPDELIIDFQIDTAAIKTDFDNLLYASENDYWYKLPENGIGYDGNVYIANGIGMEDQYAEFPSGDVGVGKLLVATNATINDTNPEREALMPQLVLQYNKRTTYTGGNNLAQKARTTMWTSPDGDCEIDLYGSCSNNFGYYSLIPKEDRLFGLGNDTNRWKSIKSSELFELYLGEDSKTDGVEDVVINRDGDTTGYVTIGRHHMSNSTDIGMGRFGNSSVMVGPYSDPTDTLDYNNNYYYTYGNISNYIDKVFNTAGNYRYAEYSLGLRSTQNLAMFNIHMDWTSPKEFSGRHGDDATQNIADIYDMISVGNNALGNSDIAKDVANSGIFKKFYDKDVWGEFGDISTKFTSIDAIRESIYGGVSVANGYGAVGEGIDKDLLLASSQYIFTNGDILPMVDTLNNLGSYDRRYRELYIDTIHGTKHPDKVVNDNYSYEGWNLLKINADIVPNSPTTKITRSLDTTEDPLGARFERIDSKYLGQKSDPIDAGFITTINAKTITATGTITANTVDCEILESLNINPTNTGAPVGNINIGYINNIPIEEYLYNGPIDVTNDYDLPTDDWGIFTHDGYRDDDRYFKFTITGSVDQKTNEILSCVITINGGGMKIKRGGTAWKTSGWKQMLYTNDGVFEKILIDAFGQEAFDASRSVFYSKTSSEGGVSSNDASLSNDGRSRLRFQKDGTKLFWELNWEEVKNSGNTYGRTWDPWRHASNSTTQSIQILG